LTAEQVLASQKASVETLFGLTTKAFEGLEKLVELNLTLWTRAPVSATTQQSELKSAVTRMSALATML